MYYQLSGNRSDMLILRYCILRNLNPDDYLSFETGYGKEVRRPELEPFMEYSMYLMFVNRPTQFQTLLSTYDLGYLKQLYQNSLNNRLVTMSPTKPFALAIYIKDHNEFDGSKVFTEVGVIYAYESGNMSDIIRVIREGTRYKGMLRAIRTFPDPIDALTEYLWRSDVSLDKFYNSTDVDVKIALTRRTGIATENYLELEEELSVAALNNNLEEVKELLNSGTYNYDDALRLTTDEKIKEEINRYKESDVYLTTFNGEIVADLRPKSGNKLPSVKFQQYNLKYVKSRMGETKEAIDNYESEMMLSLGKENRRVDLIHRALKDSPILNETPYTAYRVATNEFTSKGFLSASLLREKVEKEAIEKGVKMMIVNVPVGTHSLYIEGKNKYEMLFDYGITLKKISEDDKTIVLDIV